MRDYVPDFVTVTSAEKEAKRLRKVKDCDVHASGMPGCCPDCLFASIGRIMATITIAREAQKVRNVGAIIRAWDYASRIRDRCGTRTTGVSCDHTYTWRIVSSRNTGHGYNPVPSHPSGEVLFTRLCRVDEKRMVGLKRLETARNGRFVRHPHALDIEEKVVEVKKTDGGRISRN